MEKSLVFKVTLHQLVFRWANLFPNIKVQLWHFESSEVFQFSQKLDFYYEVVDPDLDLEVMKWKRFSKQMSLKRVLSCRVKHC